MVVPAMAHLTVIGCGNLNRCDDGVGVFVVRALMRGPARDGVQLFDAGTDGMGVMFQARGTKRLVIVDAAKSGSPPGAVFKVPGDELAAVHERSLNLHDFRWDHALAAGRRIFRDDFPDDVTVYLIEAGRLDLGLELTPAVQAAAEQVIAEIRALIDG